MTKSEAHELALMHVQFGHDLGEAALRQGEFWISVSYGLLVLAFVAPHALNKVTTPLVLTLYILYSSFITTNSYFDLSAAEASRADADRLVAEFNLNLKVLEEKNREKGDLNLPLALGSLHAPGLFLGTVGYVCFVSYRNCRKGRRAKD